MSRGKDRNSLLLALDKGLRCQLVLVVRVHAPVATLTEPQPLLLTGSLHEVLVQGQVVTDGVLEGDRSEIASMHSLKPIHAAAINGCILKKAEIVITATKLNPDSIRISCGCECPQFGLGSG